MKIVVLDAATLGSDICLEEWKQLGELTVYSTTPPELLAERLKDCEVAILNKSKIDSALLEKLPKLKLISITATGYDNVDINACRSRGIAVCNVKGYSTHSVAQVTLAIALSLITHLPDYAECVNSGAYTSAGIQNCLEPVFHEINGKTWGIAGLGGIGKQVARVAMAMGCDVLAYKQTPIDEFTCVDLKTLCQKSDILSLHLPLSEQTRGCIGENEIKLMKKDAILINMARGAIIDEAAVVKAIEENRLGGFGTDVFAPEPLTKDSPLQRILNRSNVIATPHMAWGAYESRMRCISEITENIKAFYRGDIKNRVDI